MSCILCYEMSSPLQKLRRYVFHVLRYGARVSRVMAGWIAEMLFMLLFAYIAV